MQIHLIFYIFYIIYCNDFCQCWTYFFHFDILLCTITIAIRQRHIYLDYEFIVTLICMHIAKICLISCSILGI